MSSECFGLLLGIGDNPLVVGFDKNGELANFLPEHWPEYRPPLNEDERIAMAHYAADIYRTIADQSPGLVTDFGLIPVLPSLIEKIANNEELYGQLLPLAYLVGDEMVRVCENCHKAFIAKNPVAKYCADKDCQRSRINAKQTAYYKRKSNNKRTKSKARQTAD